MTRRSTDIEERPANPYSQAIAALTEERGSVYGPPRENFRRIAALQAVIAECKDPLVKVGLDMIAVKISRLIETPTHLDSIKDIAGYAHCIEQIIVGGRSP